MCDPVSMAATMFAAHAAGTIVGAIGQNAAATANANNAISALNTSYAQGTQEIVYHDTEAAQKDQQNQRQTRAAEATALTSAGEGGVQGNSVASLANDYMGQSAVYRGDVETNRRMQDSEIMLQMKGMRTQAQSEINRVQPASTLSTVLGIGGAAASSAAAGWNMANPPVRVNP